ncbi:MAG: DMT family transporter, partial [Chitinophagaceae bacterium]|nr:DMT family transporter [Rubrivivax sp.]
MPSTPASRRALWIGGLCALAVMVIWTSFILVARASATRTLSPFDIAWLRFVFSGLVALPWLVWRGSAFVRGLGHTPAQAWQRGATLAAVAGVGYCMFAYSGFFFAPVAHGAVLLPGALPMWTALLATLLIGERLTWARAAGLALIAAGAALVGGTSLLQAFDGSDTWRGDVLFLAGSFCWALYGVLCRRWKVGAVDATLAIALGCLVSYVPLYGAAALAGWVPSGRAAAPWSEIGVQAVFQGGLSMLVAGVAYTQVVQTFGPVRTTMLTALVP